MEASTVDETQPVSMMDETLAVEVGVKRKCSAEAGASSAKSLKRRRSTIEIEEANDRPNLGSDEEKSDVLFSDTLEVDNSERSPKLVSDSQDTIGFDLEPETQDDSQNGRDDFQDGEEPGCSKNTTQAIRRNSFSRPTKIASLQRDSEIIADFLPIGKDKIYEKLLCKRGAPNRIELVTNELLENGTDEPSEQADKSNERTDESDDASSGLIADVEYVCNQIKLHHPDVKVNPDEVYLLLEKNIKKNNKCQVVIDQLVNKSNERNKDKDLSSKIVSSTSEEPGILGDVSVVMAAYSQADANVVFGLLESQKNQEKRVECVLYIMRKKFGEPSSEAAEARPREERREASPVANDAGVKIVDPSNDPLHSDVLLLAQMFPHKTHDELYAYLQAHRNKPNRLQIVNKELLRVDEFEESPSIERSWSLNSDPGSLLYKGKHPKRVGHELELLTSVYPLCDPNYIFERLEAYQKEKNRVELVSQELENDSNYPRRKDTEASMKRQAELKKLQDIDANVDEMIAEFPNITDHFYSSEKAMSESYKKHLDIQLKYDFPWLKGSFLTRVSKAHNFHLLPTYRQMQGLRPSDVRRHSRKFIRSAINDSDTPEYPNELDSYFFKELLFTMNEEKFNGKIKKMKEERDQRLEEARSLGMLQECRCCYDDEVLLEDTLNCPEGHIFCKACVRRSTEVNVGDAKSEFPCLTAECKTSFTLPVIQEAVSQRIFGLVLRRIQETELREAGIENLVTCPFCSFATIMENPDDKVFKCLNPECMKESCRLCQEENHIPLRCEEVEKQNETDMRTYIENKMSEAMVRTCYKCKKRFYKIEGCNYMTCVCGAHMCYACRAPLDGDAQHLNEDGRCNIANAAEIHAREVAEALAEARESYLREHPEAGELVLKYNPEEHLKSNGNNANVTEINFRGNWFRNQLDDEDEYRHYHESDLSDSDEDYDEDYY